MDYTEQQAAEALASVLDEASRPADANEIRAGRWVSIPSSYAIRAALRLATPSGPPEIDR